MCSNNDPGSCGLLVPTKNATDRRVHKVFFAHARCDDDVDDNDNSNVIIIIIIIIIIIHFFIISVLHQQPDGQMVNYRYSTKTNIINTTKNNQIIKKLHDYNES
jgi:hypothetical protein